MSNTVVKNACLSTALILCLSVADAAVKTEKHHTGVPVKHARQSRSGQRPYRPWLHRRVLGVMGKYVPNEPTAIQK